MPIDLSRVSHDPEKRYSSVRLQQGRVLLDADWNEQADITSDERAHALTDVIGPSGTSDEAFRVGTPTTTGGVVDFPLGAGTFYLGGRRINVESDQRFRRQLDLLAPPHVDPPSSQRHDLVWVEVWEMPITAVEDPELREVGLGGPDTAARTRLLGRVHVDADVGTDDCGDAWAATVGASVDDRARLTTDVTATVTFVDDGTGDDGTGDDLCAPEAITGYLRHDNQALRVELTGGSTFCWGFDNAASLYRVQVQADRREIVFSTLPVDEAHRPRSGQVVELLAWGALLSNGEKVAEPTGVFGVVQQGYDPDDFSIVLQDALPDFGENDWSEHPDASRIGAAGTFVYLRVWDRGDDLSVPNVPFTPSIPVALGTTGLRIQFDGTQFRTGDHWVIAARPAEPTHVVPWVLADARPPHGPQRLRAPLALIAWPATGRVVVEDCRRRFRSLTELQSCCEFSVGDGEHSFGDFTSIQDAIDALPPTGGRVCVNPGTYEERIVLSEVRNVEIRGCGIDVILVPPPDRRDNSPLRTPVAVVIIEQSRLVSLSGLQIRSSDGTGIAIGHKTACRDIELRDLSIAIGATAAAIDIRNDTNGKQSEQISIIDCDIMAGPLDAPPKEGETIELAPAIFSQCDQVVIERNRVRAKQSKLQGALGGVQIGGLSSDVVVRHNKILGGNGHGIVIGSIHWQAATEKDTDFLKRPAAPIGLIAIFLARCLEIGVPARPPGSDPDDVLTPVSDGLIERLDIDDNVITEMAGDGIGVVHFFLEDDIDIIGVERLRVRRNHIIGNRTTAPPIVPAWLAMNSGHGGIALGAVTDGTFENNRVEANGVSSRRPVCGLFVLAGAGLSVVDNHILANGFGNSDDSAAQIGRRGGVVVALVNEIDVPATGARSTPRDVSALRVVDNVIDQPIGQALWVTARGRVAVRGNQLSSGILPVSALVQAVFDMVRRGDLSEAIMLALHHLAGSAVTIIDLGLPIDPGIHHVVDLIGKSKAGIQQLASEIWSSSFAGPIVEDEVDNRSNLTNDAAKSPDRWAQLLVDGHVQFSDNQVLLDLIEGEVGISLCSVLIASLDDVAVQGNQLRCITDADIMFSDVIAVALNTVRFTGNRSQELPRSWYRNRGYGALGVRTSFFTGAIYNVTTSNQCTNPFNAVSINPTTEHVEHNTVLHLP